jgi:hypothetical protein
MHADDLEGATPERPGRERVRLRVVVQGIHKDVRHLLPVAPPGRRGAGGVDQPEDAAQAADQEHVGVQGQRTQVLAFDQGERPQGGARRTEQTPPALEPSAGGWQSGDRGPRDGACHCRGSANIRT